MKCKSYNIVPKFLHFKLYKRKLLSSKLYREWQFKLLNIEIKSRNKDSRVLCNQLKILDQDLKNNVSFLDYIYLKSFVAKNVRRYVNKILETHDKKLKNLGLTNKFGPINPDNVIFNYSNRVLSEKEKYLLAFGLTCKLPLFKIDFYDWFLSFEKCYQLLSKLDEFVNERLPPLKHVLQTLSHKLYYNFKPHKVFSSLFSKSDVKILKDLSKDESIIICKPDKGRGIVILNKCDYKEKIYHILNDPSKFMEIKDVTPLLSTLRAEGRLNSTINRLKNNSTIDSVLASKLSASGSCPGVMYGLPKIHKPNVPMRPILSANNTTSYNLSQYLVPLLSDLSTNEFTIKNSYDFANYVNSLEDSSKYIMCSFDIESLFTNIPLDETIEVIISQLFPDATSTFHNFNKSEFKSLLNLATKSSTFLFDQKLYKQIDGVAMGTPCGPTLANIFLCFHEQNWLNNCPPEFKPKAYKRYVDDTFLLFENLDQIENFLNYLNAQHPNIRFTKEVENSESLSFLDILITKVNNKFETSVFRKETFTGLGMHFLSFEPIIYKINALQTLIYRAYHLSSNYLKFHNEINFLHSFFHNNGFPSNMFYKYVKQFLNKQKEDKPKEMSVPKLPVYVAFPYYGYVSEKVKSELKDIVFRRFPQINFRPIFRNNCMIGSFFRHKEKLPTSMCSNLVYSYKCLLCNKQYIGSTVRQLQCRISEHMGVSVRTGLPMTNNPNSAIFKHRFDTDHPIEKDEFKIKRFCHNRYDVRLLEALYIKKERPELNDGLPVELSLFH